MLKTERTKIVATLGPASSNREVLGELVEAGLDVVRLNFSHGERADQQARFDLVRRSPRSSATTWPSWSTSRGPRSGSGWSGTTGSSSTAAARSRSSPGPSAAPSPTSWWSTRQLAADVRKGDRILLDDGAIGLRVADVEGDRVRCEVERGGVVKSRKGMNLPGVAVSAPSLTAKDRADVATAVDARRRLRGLSFVRSPRT